MRSLREKMKDVFSKNKARKVSIALVFLAVLFFASVFVISKVYSVEVDCNQNPEHEACRTKVYKPFIINTSSTIDGNAGSAQISFDILNLNASSSFYIFVSTTTGEWQYVNKMNIELGNIGKETTTLPLGYKYTFRVVRALDSDLVDLRGEINSLAKNPAPSYFADVVFDFSKYAKQQVAEKIFPPSNQPIPPITTSPVEQTKLGPLSFMSYENNVLKNGLKVSGDNVIFVSEDSPIASIGNNYLGVLSCNDVTMENGSVYTACGYKGIKFFDNATQFFASSNKQINGVFISPKEGKWVDTNRFVSNASDINFASLVHGGNYYGDLGMKQAPQCVIVYTQEGNLGKQKVELDCSFCGSINKNILIKPNTNLNSLSDGCYYSVNSDTKLYYWVPSGVPFVSNVPLQIKGLNVPMYGTWCGFYSKKDKEIKIPCNNNNIDINAENGNCPAGYKFKKWDKWGFSQATCVL